MHTEMQNTKKKRTQINKYIYMSKHTKTDTQLQTDARMRVRTDDLFSD